MKHHRINRYQQVGPVKTVDGALDDLSALQACELVHDQSDLVVLGSISAGPLSARYYLDLYTKAIYKVTTTE